MFRRARTEEEQLLDEMTLAGMRYWGHHETHPAAFENFSDQLRTQPGVEEDIAFVLEDDNDVVAFYQLRNHDDHVELLRMFMRTDLIGRGYGRRLWNHAVSQASRTHKLMRIVSDPAATGFYETMGATFERGIEVEPGLVLSVYWYTPAMD